MDFNLTLQLISDNYKTMISRKKIILHIEDCKI